MIERILIVDTDPSTREHLDIIVAPLGIAVISASDAVDAFRQLETQSISIVLCDPDMRGLDGFDLPVQIARRRPDLPIVLVSDRNAEVLASETLRRNAFAYLTRPLRRPDLLLTLERARERERIQRQNACLTEDIERSVGHPPIVAASPVMIDLLESIENVAGLKTPALLSGERGTGKESLARIIHAQSPRRSQPFVVAKCAAIPEAAMEAAFFGSVQESRDGAAAPTRPGLFAQAQGGTLLLDEVGMLPGALQARVLRAIQDEEFTPVGESKPHASDVRILSASSARLPDAIEKNRFREDLYYRLNVMPLEIPALRERREDIPLLCDHFMAHFREHLNARMHGIADDALERLVEYAWPGNILELKNVIERVLILSQEDRMSIHDLPGRIVNAPSQALPGTSRDFSLRPARRRFEIDWIRRTLRETGGNRTHAARLLEISHRALLYKLKEYGINS